MSEYWKSTGKKYCDFCKCWTADNKSSIDFHERGKNHQANVQRRLGEIKRNSIEKRNKDESSQRMFEQMEKAALAAVQKDIVGLNDGSVGKSDLKSIVSAHSADANSQNNETYPWTAMTAPQGFTYYYNALTGESTWIMPEVFKKLEQDKKKAKEAENETRTVYKIERDFKKINERKTERMLPPKRDTTMDPYRNKPQEEPEELHNVHPLLGGWSTVKRFEVDEELDAAVQEEQKSSSLPSSSTDPEQTNNEKSDPSIDNEKERTSGKKFKEKVIKTNIVTTDEPVSFKKRKTKIRNMRKRDDDD